MIEAEVPLKRKDQVALDEEIARNLEAQLQDEFIEEEKMARKKEEEANIALIESHSKKQMTDENEEVEEDNEAELKKHLGIDREDLKTLWNLVKIKHGNTRPKMNIKENLG
ncbi:hypothetical protein Tco_1311251 [Tanacetum coccineum]